MSATVMSVLGAIGAESLGVVDAHDHVLIGRAWGTHEEPDLLIDSEEAAQDELTAFGAAGGVTVVDAMPTACGRNAPGLARLSAATGISIVATSGYHLAKYYPPWHWYHRLDVDGLAQVVRDEVLLGIDEGEFGLPYVSRSDIRPGALKAAVGFHRVSDPERRALEAVAVVQRESGLPLMIHVEGGADPDLALDLLDDAGVDPSRVVLAHMDRNPDRAVHRRALDRGAFLSYDGLYREAARPVSAVIDLLRAAGDQLDRILVGGDVARRSLRRVSGGMGLAGFAGGWRGRITAELGADTASQLFTINPARFLAGHADDASSRPSSTERQP